jgi:hypothetical protein
MHVVDRSHDLGAGPAERAGSVTEAVSSGMPATVDPPPGAVADRA